MRFVLLHDVGENFVFLVMDSARVVGNVSTQSSIEDTFSKRDSEIYKLFCLLDDHLSQIVAGGLTLSDLYKVLLGGEHVLVRLRSLVLREVSECNCALSSNSTKSGLVTKLYRDRLGVLISYCQRLNELRDDFSVVQRSMYVSKMTTL